MKTIAMYLPQFHRTPENDEWWGEGFTDWVAVKGAKSLFDGHRQPRVPLDEKYYDLLQKDVMQWQADLMKEYGVDGVCMYHYWFKDGRRILEKPMENLLKWTDIDMPYCICWANETWARSWSNIDKKNAWMSVSEKENSSGDDGVLLLQEYGDQAQWEEHFNYLLPFFKDKRYIRVENKPVLLLYKVSDIICLEEMLNCWRKLSYENGFEGVYIIGGNPDAASSDYLDGALVLQPQNAIKSIRQITASSPDAWMRLDYDEVWREVLSVDFPYDIQTYYEGFSSYDDSPRRGTDAGIVENSTPGKFKTYLKMLMKKNSDQGSDLVFINAWNEWGEGMYLEPDMDDGYAYLEAVLDAKKTWMNDDCGDFGQQFNKSKEELAALKRFNDRINGNLIVMSKWMELLEKGFSLADHIKTTIGNKIVLYGWGILGEHLYKQICDEIEIEFIIDQNVKKVKCDEIAYQPSADFPVTGTVIVTSVYYYSEIKKQMEEKGFETIISLESIIDSCLKHAL